VREYLVKRGLAKTAEAFNAEQVQGLQILGSGGNRRAGIRRWHSRATDPAYCSHCIKLDGILMTLHVGAANGTCFPTCKLVWCLNAAAAQASREHHQA
jgi:hypothetical protein